jgi:hypothetical protein
MRRGRLRAKSTIDLLQVAVRLGLSGPADRARKNESAMSSHQTDSRLSLDRDISNVLAVTPGDAPTPVKIRLSR